MEEIKNLMDKLVCRVDKSNRIVEIVSKGYKTIIHFFDDGNVKIINTDKIV